MNSQLSNTANDKRFERSSKTMIKAAEVENTWSLFPPSYQEYLSAAKDNVILKKRIVVAYVASMTEHELARIHTLLTGRS